jgi:mono/diheme cytochrome c family protein
MVKASLLPAVLLLCSACALAEDAATSGDPFERPVQAVRAKPVPSPVKGFTVYGGQWIAKDGELQASGSSGPRLISNEPPFAAGEASVEVFFADGAAGNAGLVVKASDCGIGADRFNGYEVALQTSGHLVIGRHRQNFESIRNVPCPVPTGKWISLAVKMTENTLEVAVDGKTIFQYEDRENPLAVGQVGLRQWQREARYRNFSITAGGQTKRIPFEPAAVEAAPPAPAALPETLSLERLPPIAFFTRHELSSPNTISCDIWQTRPAKPGCSIRIIDPARPDLPARTIFSDPDGCIYDMNVSYDALTLFFSYRTKDEKYWHLWRINTDGTGLKQLTDGPYYDISPALLPDGDIVFVSTRRGGYTVCQPGPASNLHRMAADGSNIRCVSMNTLSDFSPQMLPDGRVLFTRWEYIDRDLTYRQSLWTQNPDGTGYQLYFGNTIRDVGTFWQARPIPGRTDRVVSTFAPHHGHPHGAIGLIDTRFGPEGPRGKGFAWITNEFPEIGDRHQEWSYRDPFPLSDRTFLCAYGGGGAERFRIYLLDWSDNKRLIYEDPKVGCYNPLALRPSPVPPLVAPRPRDESADCGTFLMVDVYRGLEPTIKRGQVKFIRVMEQVRKTEDLVNRAYDQSPVMSYGTYYAKRSWGTAPVMEDGSAYFKAPALREIYFQALDAEGRELQRMTSGAQVMPGETVSCVGCHESRVSSPPGGIVPLAARQPPVDLEKPPWGNDGIVDFPTIVQPVLDKYCVKCHSGTNPDGGCDLSGDKTRLFSMAYDNLLGRSRSYRQHDMTTGEMLPSEAAKGKPLVHFYWLLRTPTAVNLPLWTGSHASRLLDYIDKEHGGQPIPLEDRQRIYVWIDADVPYYGTYAHSRPKSAGRRDRFTDPESGREHEWFARDFLGVYDRHCASCHGKFPNPNDHKEIWDGRTAWINLSRPQFSAALTAHLAKEAGGRGINKPQDGKAPPMFPGVSDPDYQAMLKAIDAGRELMLAAPEADMPGFKFARKEP